MVQGRFRRQVTMDDSDHELVVRAALRAKAGDREALRFLYVHYADNIYGYVASIVHDEHEAEDLTQHVFAKLMTALAKYEPRAVPFSAWILRVARNVALDHLRQRTPILAEEVHPVHEGTDGGMDHLEALREGLAGLPDDQREVVVLRHLVGLSPGEIAERMGKTEGAIHGLHHRARRRLQQELVRLEAAPVHRPARSTREKAAA